MTKINVIKDGIETKVIIEEKEGVKHWFERPKKVFLGIGNHIGSGTAGFFSHADVISRGQKLYQMEDFVPACCGSTTIPVGTTSFDLGTSGTCNTIPIINRMQVNSWCSGTCLTINSTTEGWIMYASATSKFERVTY